VWARAHLRDLEDRYVSQPYGGDSGLEQRIVATSVRFGVLCRFTAWIAVDERVVTEGNQTHRVIQPVELPAGWDMPVPAPAMMRVGMARTFAAAMSAPMRATDLSDAAMYEAPGRARGLSRKSKRSLKDRLRGGTAMPAPPEELEAEVAAPPSVSVRELAASEAQRLRAAVAAPEYERRELLADLGTRLEALARELGGSAEATSVRDLAAELTEGHLAGLAGDAMTELWDRVLQLLDRLAGPTSEGGGPTSAAFWKRR
jgi:Ca-activated chloride channel homolog